MDVVFLNGNFVPKEDAKISVFDTGFYYGDGIYEVTLLKDHRIIDLELHLARLKYVLKEVKFNNPPSAENLKTIIHELVLRNKEIKDGIVYIQITRGVMEYRYDRLQDIKHPTLIAYIVPIQTNLNVKSKAVKCELIDDPRRYRRDIKMTSLMPMILAKIQTQDAGYDYTIFKDRISKAVTEGASSNLFIVNDDGTVLTHPIGKKILNGCVRKRVVEFLRDEKFSVKEQEFFEDDLLNAKEAFLTGSIKLIAPIESVNGQKIGDGSATIAMLCMEKYLSFIETFPKVC